MHRCIIIGSGPAGMASALYLKRAGIEPLILEKAVPGGEMLKTNKIENYLGFDSIDGGELSLKMSKQIKNLNIQIIRDEVISISKDSLFKVKCGKDVYFADYVIVASGRKPRQLGISDEREFIGKGISYCAICDGAFYRFKEVAVIGGGDSALTEALYLSDLCTKVYIVARGNLKASEILVNRVKEKSNIVILKNVQVVKFIKEDSLSGIELSDGHILDVSGVFIAIGGMPEVYFLNDLDVLMKNGYIITNEKMETNIKGLYAVGDVRYKDFYQIVTAISDGAIAALSIREDV